MEITVHARADDYIGPRWRFVGNYIEAGTVSGRDVSQRTLLNLAQNSGEKAADWNEVNIDESDQA